MRLENFTIAEDLIGVDYSGQYLDLHNSYKLNRFSHRETYARFEWERLDAERVSDTMPHELLLRLEVTDVTYFDVRGQLSDHIEEMGFFENDTLGHVEYSGANTPEPGREVLVFRFVSGGEIAVMGRGASAAFSINV